MIKLTDLDEYELMELTADEHGNVEHTTFDSLLRRSYDDQYDGAEGGEPVGSVMFHFPANGFDLPLNREVDCCDGMQLFYEPKSQYQPQLDCYIVEYEVV